MTLRFGEGDQVSQGKLPRSDKIKLNEASFGSLLIYIFAHIDFREIERERVCV